MSLSPNQRSRNSRKRDVSKRHQTVSKRSKLQPLMEGLEDRALLTAISVTNLDDSGAGSLRQAIITANELEGPDTIEFAEGMVGTISLTSGQLEITDELTIDGPGAESLTVSGSELSRVFLVTGTKVTMDDIRIADGMATDFAVDVPEFEPWASGGGIRNVSGDVTLNEVHVVNNTAHNAVANGGGIGSSFGGTVSISNSTFSGNKALGLVLGSGGAVSGNVSVTDSNFTGNQAVALSGFNPDIPFSGLGYGGAISAGNDAQITVINSQFEANFAKGGDGIEGSGQSAGFAGGGAIGISNTDLIEIAPSTLNVSGSTFTGNQSIGGSGANGPDGVPGGSGAPGYSGAIHVAQSHATISDSQFVGNRVNSGDGGNGGSGADGGDSGVYGNEIFVGSSSGAMGIDGGSATVIDSSFTENVVVGGKGGQGGFGGDGGDARDAGGGGITVVAPYLAGTIATTTVDLTNVTIANNTVVAGTGGQAGEGGTDGDNGVAEAGGLNVASTSGVADQAFATLTDVTITGNTVQASSSELLRGAGLLADMGTNVALTDVNVSENKGIANNVETEVDGYTCDGIVTAEGNCQAPLQGDADRDGDVDIDDFLALSAAFGQEGDWLNGDFDRDGSVGFSDFLLLSENYEATRAV